MATIHDVARAAGVSIATVSRSLNGQSRVSEITRRRVLDTAAALDFRPNRAARGLVTGQLGNIGVLLPDVANPFFAPVLVGIEGVAQERDMGVFLADSREDVGVELELCRRLVQQVDGLVLVASRLPEVDLRTLAAMSPTVLVNRVVEGLDAVAIDGGPGMAELLEQLARLGHREVLYLDGPRASWSGGTKLAGLRAAAARLDVELTVDGPHSPSFVAGRAAAQRVLDSGCTAVIAYDDLIAWGVLTRVQELGVRVPAELSVAGFDDSLEEGMSRPALTTVTGRSASMGTIAAEMLARRLGDRNLPPARQMLACHVVVRGSTAPVPSSLVGPT